MSSAKIYTKTGDKGLTGLLGGSRVSKSDFRLEAYGALDELNSEIGRLLSVMHREENVAAEQFRILHAVQSDLFVIGSHLACEKREMRAKLSQLPSDHIENLEKAMDQMSAGLAPLKNFVLPGGHEAAALAHVCRTTCRRAERLCVKLDHEHQTDSPVTSEFMIYINRLSDYFFVLARFLNKQHGVDEPIWKP